LGIIILPFDYFCSAPLLIAFFGLLLSHWWLGNSFKGELGRKFR